MVKILIIDKQRSIRNILREKLEFEGYGAESAEDLATALDLLLTSPFDVVIIDEDNFNEYLSSDNNTITRPVIVTSDSPAINLAVNAVKKGAHDFISKPIDMNQLLVSLKKACDSLNNENPASDKEGANTARPAYQRNRKNIKSFEIIGDSIQINHVKKLIDKVAPSDAKVLITGPNGTGKELVAHWLHMKSHRCDTSFVEVNCAAIPSELIENELFGHEKGAFTSAIKQRKGKFEQANGGILFLDEIGDMSLSAQAKVLRALQENRICRVGSDKDIVVDVRVVAATNKNLREEINKGFFREDLYHRLSVILIPVPPLIDRIDDIPLLVDHFIEDICAEYGMSLKHVDNDAVEELKNMRWTGNIRELRNVVERLLILGGDHITCEDVRTYAM